MPPEVRLVIDAAKGFRDECGLSWKDTAMLLEFSDKDCRPNKFLEGLFYYMASFCHKLPESVMFEQIEFHWKEG